MKAILLAAGVGTRIARELQLPKSCLEVNGKPIIRHTVELLKDNGIPTTVVVGYEKSTIFDALSGLDVDYFFNPFYKVTNSIASLWFARERLNGEDDLLIGNADVFFEQSILDIVTDGRKPRTMLVDKTRVEVGDYFVKTVDGRLTAYGKELPLSERTAEYVGLACIRSEAVCDFSTSLETLVEQGRYNLWWENALYEFCLEKPVYIKDVEGRFWGEIDYIEDYKRILAYLDSKKATKG